MCGDTVCVVTECVLCYDGLISGGGSGGASPGRPGARLGRVDILVVGVVG